MPVRNRCKIAVRNIKRIRFMWMLMYRICRSMQCHFSEHMIVGLLIEWEYTVHNNVYLQVDCYFLLSKSTSYSSILQLISYIAKRRTRNEKTLHADLLLAGIAQLLTVIVADKIHKHQYIRSLKPLIA